MHTSNELPTKYFLVSWTEVKVACSHLPLVLQHSNMIHGLAGADDSHNDHFFRFHDVGPILPINQLDTNGRSGCKMHTAAPFFFSSFFGCKGSVNVSFFLFPSLSLSLSATHPGFCSHSILCPHPCQIKKRSHLNVHFKGLGIIKGSISLG